MEHKMKLSSRIKLLAEAEEILNKMKNPVKETSLNEATGDLAFPMAIDAFKEYENYLKKASVLKSKITKTLNQESQKYLSGKWDIIVAPGSERWGGQRKLMQNDIYNWYNAKIRNIYIESIGIDSKGTLPHKLALKGGKPKIYFVIDAVGDNTAGEERVDMNTVKIYKAYQSPEGKEYKKGY